MTTPRAMVAEFIGTFAYMFVGGGAIILTAIVPGGAGGLVTVALAHGIILAVMITATMHISGGQINPAVSIGLSLVRRQPWSQAIMFILAQVFGAVMAAGALKFLVGGIPVSDGPEMAVDFVKLGATLGDPRYGLDALSIFGLEAIATFFLMFTVMGSAVDTRGVGRTMSVGGFAIGLTLTAAVLCIGPLTGASLNPARSLGPAIVGGHWQDIWIYLTAPVVGAAAAALVFETAFQPRVVVEG